MIPQFPWVGSLIGLAGLQSRCWWAVCLSGHSGKNPFACSFRLLAEVGIKLLQDWGTVSLLAGSWRLSSASRGHQHSLVCGSFISELMTMCQVPLMPLISPASFSMASLTYSSASLFYFLKDYVMTLGS